LSKEEFFSLIKSGEIYTISFPDGREIVVQGLGRIYLFDPKPRRLGFWEALGLLAGEKVEVRKGL